MSDDDKGGLPAVAVNLAALRKKANQALDDCEFYSGGTGQKLEVLAMHGEAALSMIPTILAEFRSAIARAEAAEAERDEARRAIAWANNSLFGSHAFFLSLDGGPPNEHHLDTAIENLKGLARETFKFHARAEAAEAQVAKLREALVDLLSDEGRTTFTGLAEASATLGADDNPWTRAISAGVSLLSTTRSQVRAALEPADG